MSNSTCARIPYEERSDWMANVHYNYGKKLHLHDIDYVIGLEGTTKIWMEHMSKEGMALTEFKNAGELIELYKYGQLIWLADGRNIPAYIVVGCKEPYVYYYLIPLNDACKKIPSLDKPRYMSERNYVKFLHYIRKIKAEESTLVNLNNSLPPEEERFQPNIR